MLQLIRQHQFIAGIAALWLYSAAVGSLDAPDASSGKFYRWFYRFAKTIAGDLTLAFGKYLPPAAKAAVIAFFCLALTFAPIVGCSQQQKVNVAQEIVNWTPALTSAVNTAGSLVQSLDPPAAVVVMPTLVAIDALSPQLVAAAKTYLANPNQTSVQLLQALIVQLQNNTNTALLNAAKITNPDSQRKAMTAINGISTIVNSLLALIESVSSKQQVAAMSRDVTVHLAQVRSLLDRESMQLAANRISADLRLNRPVSVDQYFALQAQAGF